ncbi:Uncharacterised protein [Salmonella enterica subsp. enterica serovar Bovismorbificans]|nr:hypothetical protein SPFCAV_04553 [Salmonella enterica subsp. enterica serovar Gallinarum/Pullorum str. FCAV198]CPR77071.1 Uncharacterised protein [Salmonella enterica subsp. enterica serovar Bovismorbificans]CQI78631.1 Uncharacterised protein [Salmonella enterica subsp. enterica serovar Typhimurium str. DT104]CQM45648.1 Uncharacterised protein [Salmonella enterica subsp. enterica serovar Typhimurium str. DT104]
MLAGRGHRLLNQPLRRMRGGLRIAEACCGGFPQQVQDAVTVMQ